MWLKKYLHGSFEHFRTYRRLRKYSRRSSDSDFRKMTIFQFLGVALHTSAPYFWGLVISSINALNFDTAKIWLLASGGLKCMVEILNYNRRVVRDRCLSKLRLYLGESLYEKFFAKSVGEHLREGTHLSAEYIRKGEQNGLSMEDTILVEGYAILGEFICVISFLCILVPFAGLSMLGIVVINLVWNLRINHKVFTIFSPIEKMWRELGRFIEERIDKVFYIKNHAQEANTIRLYKEKFNETYKQDHSFWKWHFKSIRARDILNLVLWILVLLYGLNKTQRGELSVGLFLSMLLWSQSVMDKVWRLTEMEARLSKLMASVKIALDELEKPSSMDENGSTQAIETISKIEFKDVSFQYQNGLHTIRNFNLQVSRGDRVAIVGPSGSGKTTLMHLLMRHYDPNEGGILIDGRSLKHLSLKRWRRIVGLIPQHIDLLDGTVLDNIGFGITEGVSDRNRLLEVADDCQILEFGDRLIHGLDTNIGEDGVQLSGGQRQRVAWATAVAKNPEVLIIDEGTSNLDALTEDQLVKNLNTFCSGKISFIIAHRLATLKSCTKFVVLKPIKDCRPDENQIEAIANSFDECEKQSPMFRAMLKQQGLYSHDAGGA